MAEHGSFSRAADALFVTQPTLSEGVASVERDLGVRLFRRRARPVELTDEGRAVVAQARLAVRAMDRVREAVEDVTELRSGRLRIAATGQAAASRLAAMLGRFARRHPAVDIHLEAPEHPGAVADLVRTARCDLGVTYRSSPRDLSSVPFGEVTFQLVCPPETPVDDSAVPLGALPGRLILPLEPGTVDAELRRLGGGPEDLAPVVHTRLRELIVPLVLAGVGVTFLPTGLAAAAAAQGAVVVDTSPSIRFPLTLLHRPDDTPPAAAAFLAMVRQEDGPSAGPDDAVGHDAEGDYV